MNCFVRDGWTQTFYGKSISGSHPSLRKKMNRRFNGQQNSSNKPNFKRFTSHWNWGLCRRVKSCHGELNPTLGYLLKMSCKRLSNTREIRLKFALQGEWNSTLGYLLQIQNVYVRFLLNSKMLSLFYKTGFNTPSINGRTSSIFAYTAHHGC
jgi:hypothetical protein